MNTYQQLEKIVLPHLRNYKEDLTKHDFNTLQEYTGKFLYGYRPTGTNLIKIPESVKDYFKPSFYLNVPKEKTSAIEYLRDAMYNDHVWITQLNQVFYFFDGTKFIPKTKEQITLIWKGIIDTLCERLYSINEGSDLEGVL